MEEQARLKKGNCKFLEDGGGLERREEECKRVHRMQEQWTSNKVDTYYSLLGHCLIMTGPSFQKMNEIISLQ